jgi:phosphomannomutase
MDSILDNIFKAYDIRGKVGTELTPELAKKVGLAFGAWLPQEGPVAVGHDMRPDSKELAENLIAGLNLSGRDVINIGLVPSDVIYFATATLDCAGGAVVTASHNPGEYNGIKFCREQARGISIETGLQEIRDLVKFNKLEEAAQPGSTSEKEVKDLWIEHVLSFIDVDKMKPFKIAVDAGNGMAGSVMPLLQKKLPWQVTEMYYELDGTFPNHQANPLIIENLEDVIKMIKLNRLDFGIAFDGDADRAVLIDNNGKPISGTVLTSLLATYFLQKYPGSAVICNAMCGMIAKETIESRGGEYVKSKVGHSFIKDTMRKYDAIMGGEHSGHYYFRDNFYADSGLIAVVIAVYILSMSDLKLSDLVADFDKNFKIEETNFEAEDKVKALNDFAAFFKGEEIDNLDGVTVTFSSGAWVNLRPSNGEDLIRLNAEARSQEELDSIVSKAKSAIEA